MAEKEKCEVDRDAQREKARELKFTSVSIKSRVATRAAVGLQWSLANLGFTHSDEFTKQGGQRQDGGEATEGLR